MALLLMAIGVTACAPPTTSPATDAGAHGTPIVIAHRGASGFLPEHTLAAYQLAIDLGADYIEPDLVLTKDGHFVALHDVFLENTTDVEERFPTRARSDGRYYAIDFTLDDVRSLTVHHRENQDGTPVFHGRTGRADEPQRVPTLAEIVALVERANASRVDPVGLYIEIKQPRFHRDAGLPMERPLVVQLAAAGYLGRDAKAVIQSFDFDALVRIRQQERSALPLVMLLTNDPALATPQRLDTYATIVDGIGPDKHLVNGVSRLIANAHARGLFVHVWTFRADDVQAGFASSRAEIARYLDLGVDGIFTDFVEDGVEVVGAR
jgi:glycerophosphoryl diester phosphodiesterase